MGREEHDLVPLVTAAEDAGASRLAEGGAMPSRGWRRALAAVTGDRLRLLSMEDRWHAEQAAIVRQPLVRPRVVAFVSLKGGVGRTTVCVGVGHVFARERQDLVVAVDANPDSGALVNRVGQETSRTITDLLACPGAIERYEEMRAFTSRAPSGLQVLAVSLDPRAAVFLGAVAYPRALGLLGAYYRVILVDCGPGLLTGAADGVVGVADDLVIVASGAEGAADVSYRTIHWLKRLGHDAKVRDAVAVVNALDDDRRAGAIEVAFGEHCRAVVRVPQDPHLRAGGRIEPCALRLRTRASFMQLAAALAERFA